MANISSSFMLRGADIARYNKQIRQTVIVIYCYLVAFNTVLKSEILGFQNPIYLGSYYSIV